MDIWCKIRSAPPGRPWRSYHLTEGSGAEFCWSCGRLVVRGWTNWWDSPMLREVVADRIRRRRA